MSDHALGILGLIVGVLGLIVGGVGIWLAVKSDRKMKTAQQARRRVENKLLRHMAVRSLENLAETTLVILGKIKSREWAVVAESAEQLGQRVVEVRAAWSQLLEPLEKDKLDAAAKVYWIKKGNAFTATIPSGVAINFVLGTGAFGIAPGWDLFTVRDKAGDELIQVKAFDFLAVISNRASSPLMEATNQLFEVVARISGDELERAIESLKKL